ncbi:hypothetical protein M9Y10_010732 [Tritrichomonas musculus]|uniref:F5/8 type C domain containing protein n=1 Tax=Tritrichomonas musculus TaxID=1915356 RepID=A0ABR2IME5_9EUKA
MSLENHIRLECSCIIHVPIQKYCNDFTFIVNGKEFQTSRLISDLLSPKICQFHSIDPTIDVFTINTTNQGDFSHILQLVNFKTNKISVDEIPFIAEVLEILCNDKIKIEEIENIELTTDNIIEEIQKREKNRNFYSETFLQEIEFISTVMGELIKTQEDQLMNLQIDTLEMILSNPQLSINSEDELLQFLNKLYERNSMYSILYEYVYFDNVTSPVMKKFTEMIRMDDITTGCWKKLCERLDMEINISKSGDRYRKRGLKVKTFIPSEKDAFTGIINYLREESFIEDAIEVVASSCNTSYEEHQPKTVVLKENPQYYFISKDEEGSWLMIDFKDHRVVPSHYTIRSRGYDSDYSHPKSWVAEVAGDDRVFKVVDEEKNCSYLNGNRLVHTFKIDKELPGEYRFFRIRQTGPDWYGAHYLTFETIELYGELI